MITEQKQNRRRSTERINSTKFRHFDEATFNIKIDYRNTVRQLINNTDMLGENKQSIIWLN